MNDLQGIDLEELRKQQALWMVGGRPPRQVLPWTDYHLAGSAEDRQLGQTLLAEGKMGCIVLAGGEGSRLGAGRPKGTIAVAGDKSLFELIAQRTRGPLAIMTSPGNHEATVHFFEEHSYFGLKEVSFFQQRELPLLTPAGAPFIREGRIAMGPNGNGEVMRQFCGCGLWESWERQGVEYLSIVPIDNPLADPFDPELLGFSHRMGNDLTLKSIFAEESRHSVGILAKEGERLSVIEYSELAGEVPKGALANLSLYCVSMAHAKGVSTKELPLHMVKRGHWKFETFIFDLWDHGEVLVYPKATCFAPLKTAEDLQLLKDTLFA
ncbi:MAG: UTP--glucose-1-phosphate uridylyltransferase [Parachlamydiales bacterium]